MSLVFADGFDHYYASNNPGLKGWINASMIGTGGRVSGGCFYGSGGNGAKYIRRIVDPASEHATFIVGFAFQWAGAFNGYPCEILRISSDNSATNHINLIINDSTGSLSIRRGGTVIAGPTAANALPANQWHHFELKAVLDDVAGSVELRKNGNVTPLLLATNVDTRNAGTKAVFDSIYLGRINQDGQNIFVDDVTICNGAGTRNNDFLGDAKVRSYYPDANGTYSQYVGSDGNSTDNYLLVDEPNSPSTSDYVSSAVDGEKDTYNFPDVSTTEQIAAVQLNSYVAKSDAGGARSVRSVARVGGADYPGTDRVLSTSYTYESQIMEDNPATSTQWTVSDYNGAEFGTETRP